MNGNQTGEADAQIALNAQKRADAQYAAYIGRAERRYIARELTRAAEITHPTPTAPKKTKTP